MSVLILMWGTTILLGALLIWAAISALVITYFQIETRMRAGLPEARKGMCVSSRNSRPVLTQAGDFSGDR